MKRLLLSLIFLILFSGCSHNQEFNPSIQQVVNKIEVHSQYDPLSFIKNTSTDDVSIEVVNNPIDISQPGNYNITYSISNDKGQSVELTYLIAVVDETKPTIHLLSDITTTVKQEFDIRYFVTVVDNFDTNLIENIKIIGEYDISTVGEYQVQLQVSDSANNTATKTVTIYVLKDESTIENQNGVVGVYKINYMDEEELNPYLVLSDDGTYSLLINYCVGLRTFSGNYSVVGDSVILESDGLTFDDDDPSSTSITMTINSDGNLVYENAYGACSPIHKDVFIKQ